MPDKSPWGGPRKGAGRKPLGLTARLVVLVLPAEKKAVLAAALQGDQPVSTYLRYKLGLPKIPA